jgi:hypothetical protein
MTTFETKVKDGNIYTNIKSAYDAYVDASKAVDAVEYGGASLTDTYLDSLRSALNTAMSNMTVWTRKTAGATASADGSYKASSMANSQSMTNVLYTYGVSSSANYKQQASWSSYLWHLYLGVQYGPIVFLYDGVSTPRTVVNLYAQKKDGSSSYGSANISTDGLTCDSYFYGVSSSTGYVTANKYTVNYVLGTNASPNNNYQSGTATYYFSGMMAYNGGASGFSKYLKTFSTQTWNVYSSDNGQLSL